MRLPVSGREECERPGKRKKEEEKGVLLGGFTAQEKQRMVYQYGELSDDDDDLYPSLCSYNNYAYIFHCVVMEFFSNRYSS